MTWAIWKQVEVQIKSWTITIRQFWVNISLDGLSLLQNAGAAKMIDMVEAEMETAKLTASDLMGTGLFGDGTGTVTSAKAIDGLRAACDDGTSYSSYGGVSRSGSDAISTAVKGQLDSTGGSITLPAVNTSMGTATIQPKKPDILCMTQTLWNKLSLN